VGLQALHAGNEGLFRRVIAQSGIGNSMLAIKTFPRFEALELVQHYHVSIMNFFNSFISQTGH
jgi:hypothetical protein